MTSGWQKDGYATSKPIIISKALRKLQIMLVKQNITLILTNQLRQSMNAMAFADPYCVDPFTTKIKIRYYKMNYIEQELTLFQFAERFINLNNFKTPTEIDISELDIQVLGRSTDDVDTYNKINKFIVKQSVPLHYTDGKLKGTSNHRIIQGKEQIYLKEHPDFHIVQQQMCVVDIQVQNTHNYYANERLNHNTTPNGLAIPHHSSVRLRLNKATIISDSDKNKIGLNLEVLVKKNRIGPPLRKCTIPLYFSSGINNYES